MPRPILSRRDFLRLSGLALVAAACNLKNAPPGVPPSPSPLPPGGSSPNSSQAAGPQTLADTPAPAEPTAHSQESFFIIDGHLDIAWNALEFGRDPHRSAHQTRLVEEDTS
ncbi:MAG TPA: twin-arginine translocation signal domain-containing protein, partial [Anaerolineales bacterium]|nr:twin-arginine translocation signal domain-containing protein [Anaerolineales bacterium]